MSNPYKECDEKLNEVCDECWGVTEQRCSCPPQNIRLCNCGTEETLTNHGWLGCEDEAP
jgi:hypothetical protein